MSKPLTIAIVRANFGADDSGGRTFEEEVLRAALEAPVPHRLIVYPSTARIKLLTESLGITHRVSLLPLLAEPGLPERVVSRAKRTLMREPAALPFTALSTALRTAGAQCAWMLGGTLSSLDLPYLGTVWDVQHRRQPWFPEVSENGEWRERERLYSEFVQRASAVVAGTHEGARELRDAYGDLTSSIHVIPLPTPSFAIEAGERVLLMRPEVPSQRYLLYPAQFWAHKNHVTAVRTLAATSAMPDPPSLVLVGSDRGTKAHVMAEAASLGVAHRVHALGFVEQSRLVALYQHADALIFPSLFGPDNLPPLEAMALGCPVIAANVAGSVEQLGDAAMLVDGLDAEAFAEAVRTLRFDAARRDALVAAGYARARSWTTRQYASAVFSLIERRIGAVRELWA